MAVYVVTWNLNKERVNYDAARRQFIQHLERYPSAKDAGLESVRWVQSSGSAQQLSDDLRHKLDNNDRIFVSELIAGQFAGWLDKDVGNWINSRL
jgi:predicted DNA-binding transcriptional regulator AlpA